MATYEMAKGLAGLGRNGDSMLMHIQPAEVAGLQALAEAQGTTLTRNPHTGLPEAFNLRDSLTSLLPTLVGVALAPGTGGASLGIPAALQGIAPIAGGALTGALIAKTKGQDPLAGAVSGGLGGYGGSGIAGSIAGFGAPTAPTAAAPSGKQLMDLESAVGPSSNTPFMPSAPAAPPTPKIGLTGPTGEMGANMGVVNKGGYDPFAPQSPVDLTQTAGTLPQMTGGADAVAGANPFMEGLDRVMENPMDFLMQNKMSVGMPLAMAGLAGLEPSDLYPMGTYKEEKYDPNATLNLGGDSKLRLLAEGGYLSSGGISSLYSNPDGTQAQNTPAEGFGASRLNELSNMQFSGYARGGYLDGPGDGMSDSIPATINGKQPARLADGEFVIPADVVSHLGNGSTKAGAKQLYSMMDRIREARTGHKKQGKQINPRKHMVA